MSEDKQAEFVTAVKEGVATQIELIAQSFKTLSEAGVPAPEASHIAAGAVQNVGYAVMDIMRQKQVQEQFGIQPNPFAETNALAAAVESAQEVLAG